MCVDEERLGVSPNSIEWFEAFVAFTKRGNLHAGLLLREESGGIVAYHQAWNNITTYQRLADFIKDYRSGVVTARPIMKPVRLRAAAKWCVLNAASGEQYAYALQLDPNAYIDERGKLVSDSANGLSCVTFVLAIFKSLGIGAIDLSGWPERSEDAVLHRYVVHSLRDSMNRNEPGFSAEYVSRVSGEIGCIRVRPEELIGGIASSPYAASPQQAISAGRFVRGMLFGLSVANGIRPAKFPPSEPWL